jgi:hypothetical protein
VKGAVAPVPPADAGGGLDAGVSRHQPAARGTRLPVPAMR